MIKLSTRLKIIYEMIGKCQNFADVGCDHGYLSMALLQGQKADFVYAMDVNRGPLETAKANISQAGLSSHAKILLSDGLKALNPGDCDGIGICGMGGLLIKRILEASLDTAKSADFMVLEPQSEYQQLRTFLFMNGFVFEDEQMVIEENKYFPVMKVHFQKDKSSTTYSELELRFGPVLLQKRPELFVEYLIKEQEKTLDLIKNLNLALEKSTENESLINRINQLKRDLELIEKAQSY